MQQCALGANGAPCSCATVLPIGHPSPAARHQGDARWKDAQHADVDHPCIHGERAPQNTPGASSSSRRSQQLGSRQGAPVQGAPAARPADRWPPQLAAHGGQLSAVASVGFTSEGAAEHQPAVRRAKLAAPQPVSGGVWTLFSPPLTCHHRCYCQCARALWPLPRPRVPSSPSSTQRPPSSSSATSEGGGLAAAQLAGRRRPQAAAMRRARPAPRLWLPSFFSSACACACTWCVSRRTDPPAGHKARWQAATHIASLLCGPSRPRPRANYQATRLRARALPITHVVPRRTIRTPQSLLAPPFSTQLCGCTSSPVAPTCTALPTCRAWPPASGQRAAVC